MTYYQLHPHVTIHDRLDGTLQLGTDPHKAVVVHGMNRNIFRLLDGSHSIADIARQNSCDQQELENLLNSLQTNSLINSTSFHDELPYLSNHERRSVLRETGVADLKGRLETVIYIHGLNRLGVLVSSLLREAGFPHLRFIDARPVTENDVQIWGFGRLDIGQRRDRTLALLHESTSRGSLHKQIHPRVTYLKELHLVVCDQQADWPILNPNLVDEFVRMDKDYLVVGYADSASFITPVVSRDTNGCLRCYFYALSDRDNSWPLIFENVIQQEVCDRAPLGLLIDSAISIAQRLVDHFSGEDSQNLVQVNWPSRLISEEAWEAHPGCGCQWDRMA
jgi:hypothetical protein